MKSNVIRGIVNGVCAVMLIASVTACGKSNEADAVQAVETVQEESSVSEAADDSEEDMMSLDDQVSAVQDTLTYMGGLKTADDADKAIDIAMFRNEDGDIIYIYEEDGSLDYGMYTTESATTDDEKEYAKIEGSIGTYGYYFNEDLVSGIIVDTTGTAYDVVELDEDGARAYVSKTLGG